MDFNISTRSKTPSGLTLVLYAEKSAFAAIAEPPSSGTPAQKVNISGSHTFIEGEGWREAWVDLDKSNLVFELLGERYSKSGKKKLTMIIPGDAEAVAGFIASDPEMILLIQKNPCQSGEYYQVGTKCQGASIAPGTKWSSGTQGGDVMGYEVMVEANQSSMLYYAGTVTMAP